MALDQNLIPDDKYKRLATLMERYKSLSDGEAAQNSFMSFCNIVWPEFIEGRHHKIMADKFDRMAKGELKRLIVNMPP